MSISSRSVCLLLFAALAVACCLPASASAAKKRADLRVASSKLSSATVTAGTTLTNTIKVSNKGKKTAGKSVAGFWISYDAKYGKGDVVAGSANVPKLKPRKSKTVKLSVTIPVDFPTGSFHMIACADGYKKVKESSEKNNCRAVKLTVVAPAGPSGPTPPPPPPDGDGDGAADATDNCPAASNPDQLDGDSDGTGDACDPCPAYFNPDSAACAATVYQVRNGGWPQGTKVAISSIVVTGIAGNRIFGQFKSGEPGDLGVQYSGITADFASSPGVSLGDLIELTGVVTAAKSLTAASAVVVNSGVAPPAPTVLTAAQLTSLSSLYDSTLVQVGSSSCIPSCSAGALSWTLENASTQYGVFSTLAPLPERLSPLASVTGIAATVGGTAGLMPRSAADILEVT